MNRIAEMAWDVLLRSDMLLYRCDGCGRRRFVRQLTHVYVPDTHFTAEICGLYCRRCAND
jgi:hypothetical protein